MPSPENPDVTVSEPSNGIPQPLSDRIEYRSPEDLKLPARLIQKYSQRHMTKLVRFLKTHGIVEPVIVTENDEVVLNVVTVLAARKMKLPQIPTVRIRDLTPVQLRVLRIGAAKLASLSEFDEAELALEFQELETLVDLDETAFDVAERDQIIEAATAASRDKDDIIPPVEGPAISALGDIWEFEGGHRFLVGDARRALNHQLLMGTAEAAIVSSDVPYGVAINGHVSGGGRIRHREFVCGGAEMSDRDFERFLKTVIRQMAAFTVPGGAVFLFIDWRHLEVMLRAGRENGLILKNFAVWKKTVAGMGSLYRSQHELIPVFQNGEGVMTNNNRMGETGRHRSNVWDFPGANSMRRGRLEDLKDHPTIKPVAMIEEILRDCSRPGEIVLDPFLGSGTTILAAHRSRRIGYGMELDPLYADVIVRRLKRIAGLEARLAVTGETFEEVAARRGIALDVSAV